MKNVFTIIFLLFALLTHSQNNGDWKHSSFILTPEILLGKTAEANDGFPKRELQKQIIINFGRDHSKNPQEWAYRLKKPKTGIGVGITDIGNLDSLGIALSAVPYIEFNVFGQKRMTILAGAGASYFFKKYDPITNPKNKAVTTDVTWAFRLFYNYRVYSTKNLDWRIGIGYTHNSNGHSRLLNQGYNSFLAGISAVIYNPSRISMEDISGSAIPLKKSCSYFGIRGGMGKNVLALAFNDLKDVYTFSGEYGKVYNSTYKIGLGFYYRFYEHYYDYIKGNESLVQDGREFDYFKKNALQYASNIGLSINAEVLLNHIGIDIQLGYNFYKPAYKIDYRINEGWANTPREIPEDWVLGELNSKFRKKQHISTRFGIKYYLLGTANHPVNNLYLGAFLNANLGQADFSELAVGYVHNFNFKGGKIQ